MVEAGIGKHRPAAERLAVLDLLGAPELRHPAEIAVIVEDAAEIAGVIGAVLLDQACRLDDAQDLGIDLAGSNRSQGISSSVQLPITRRPALDGNI